MSIVEAIRILDTLVATTPAVENEMLLRRAAMTVIQQLAVAAQNADAEITKSKGKLRNADS